MLDEICAAYDAGHRYKGLSWDETRITSTHYRRLQENNRELCEWMIKSKKYISAGTGNPLLNERDALIAKNQGSMK